MDIEDKIKEFGKKYLITIENDYASSNPHMESDIYEPL